MSAPAASKIILPDDTGNTGKNVRTQTKLVGSDTVHEHFFVPASEYMFVTKGFYSSTQQSVQASAQNGTSTGFAWLWNPVGNTKTTVIRRIIAEANCANNVATPTAPVISFTKFTATGTASGAQVTPVKWATSGTALTTEVRTAVTGLTVTLVGDIGNFYIPSSLTAVGISHATKEVLADSPLGYTRGIGLELVAGEGLVIYQSVAGTSSDPRRFGVTIEFIEVDLT